MKHLRWIPAVAILALSPLAQADTLVSYRPGYYRLATNAAFVGRIRLDANAPTAADTPNCGIVYEAIVVESISGAAAGAKLRFVSDPSLKDTVRGGDAFAVLFNHALPKSGNSECWVAAAPLFAAARPASVISFDQQGGAALGGEFLPIEPGNVLSGLQFSAIEITLDGRNRRFASWELVRAYARQSSAVRKARKLMPNWPSDPGPPPR